MTRPPKLASYRKAKSGKGLWEGMEGMQDGTENPEDSMERGHTLSWGSAILSAGGQGRKMVLLLGFFRLLF